MSTHDGDREQILADLAARARRDFQLRHDLAERRDADEEVAHLEQVAKSEPIPSVRKEKLQPIAERYRKYNAHRDRMRDIEERQLENSFEHFATFPTDVLAAFERDLRNDGLFAQAHGLNSHDGDPEIEPGRGPGFAEFMRMYKYRCVDGRYIRDYINFQPPERPLIQLAWEVLGLEAPIGLTEVARHYQPGAIDRLLLVAHVLRLVEQSYAIRDVKMIGYGAGDEIADKTRHLRYLTADFADYLLNSSPSDEDLAKELTSGPDNKFGLTLEGVKESRFLDTLRDCRTRYRNTKT